MVKQERIKKGKNGIVKKIIVICLCAMLLSLITAVSYAYFTKIDVYNAYFGASIDMMFERLDAATLETYQTTVLGGTADATAEWGSKENPYVISEVKHLNNLSALQNIGYFHKNYISKNTFDADGKYTSGESMPHFLVCKTDGTPVCITGGIKAIEPIGTEEYPFIGSVGGAFAGDKVQINNDLYSDVSTIYHVEVLSDESTVDVGLFGHITCLGDPSTATTDETTNETSFVGVTSNVSDLLLYDLNVKVDDSLWSAWTAAVDHAFSYIVNGAVQTGVPHETHHIGILAGHVTYSHVENISVYYSDENISAIDLSHVTKNTSTVDGTAYLANYMSASGFIGYLNGMNPVVNESGGIQPNTGTSNSSLIFGAGEGGGGLMSGNYTGYVVAQRVLETYQYDSKGGTPPVVLYPDADNDNDQPIKTPVYINGLYCKVDTTTENDDGTTTTATTYEALCQNASDDGDTGKYYFCDGVFTFALSQGNTDTIQPTWWTLDESGKPIEDFQVGENDPTKWKANNALPPDSVLAYVRKVNSDKELAAAITAGKQVLILNESDNAALQEKLFIMSLYNTTKGEEGNNDLNTKFYTSGLSKNYATADQIQTYIAAYQNGIWSLPEMKNDTLFQAPTTQEAMAAALDPNTGSLKAIFLGDATQTETIHTIINQYAVTVEKNANSSLSENDSGKPVAFDKVKGEVIEYFYYTRATYPTEEVVNGTTQTVQTPVDGYFICEYNAGFWGLNNTYTYYWQPLNGTRQTITQLGNNNVTDNTNLRTFWNYTTQVSGTPANQPVVLRSATINGGTTTVTGAIIYRSAEAHWGTPEWSAYTLCESGTDTSTIIDMESDAEGSDFKVVYDQPLNAWIHDMTGDTDVWYYYNPTANTTVIAEPTLTLTGDQTTGSALPYYKDAAGNIGIVVNKCPTYMFSRPNAANGKTNYLQQVTLEYRYMGAYYPLWVGADDELIEDNFSNKFEIFGMALSDYKPNKKPDSSKEATITFSKDNGVNIFFVESNNNQVRYVDYSAVTATDGTVSQQKFGSSTTKPAVTTNGVTDKLYIYVLEATQQGEVRTEEDEKRMIIVPNSATNQSYNPADYLLFASSSDADIQTDAALLDFTNGIPNGTYEVKKLTDLNWRDGEGYTLGDGSTSAKSALYKKFCITEGLDFSFQLNLGNLIGGLPSYNTPGLITAPVGSFGQQANIPQGCIAYRKNTTTTEPQYINVIVAVPITDKYDGEGGTSSTVTERYFSLWKAEESGSQLLQTFNPDDTVDRFALPHSNPYNKDWTGTGDGTTAWDTNANINYIKVKADLDNDGSVDATTYRSYLNGDRVLVAYSFSITDEGVYILGAAGKDAAGDPVSIPMEIVYFSAPGAASAGNDGAPNSQLDSIDFVYANDTDIWTVTEVTEKPADLTVAYYPSYAFFYFDTRLSTGNDFIEIDYGRIVLRRTTTAAQSTITWTPTMDSDVVSQFGKYIKFSQNVPSEQLVENGS